MNADEQQNEDIKELYKHAEVANGEMGVIKNDIAWIKQWVEKLDVRLWLILSTIILGTLIQVALKVFSK